jgi:DNA gyrase subunit A
VLPTRVPNLLVNGSSGIAVGMATNIPPHNLGEVIDACVALIDDRRSTIDRPDGVRARARIFRPRASSTARQAIARRITPAAAGCTCARGPRSRRTRKGRLAIIVNELPYQVNKARLLERIADLVRNKKIDGISELRDESDKDGMRVVIELKRGEVAEVVLNNLYKQTPMESVFGINMVALQDGQPKLLSLKEMLEAFLRHRREIVTRRTIFDLRKARDRAHILEGQTVALANIDDVIAVIKNAADAGRGEGRPDGTDWPAGAVPEMLERAGRLRRVRTIWPTNSACSRAAWGIGCRTSRPRPSWT